MNGNLTDANYLKALFGRGSFRPQRSAGQNFLICPEVVEATVLAMTGGANRVTELGAGVGTLTGALLAAGFTVKAIERDQQLAKVLTKEIPKRGQEKLELAVGDLRETSWHNTTEETENNNYQLVGNIPYNLSGFIVRRLVQLKPPPERVVLLVQQEVGERIVAQAPEMSLLSLAVSLWGEAEIIIRVPATCFWPKPKVASCLVMLTPRKKGAGSVEERERVMAVAKPFFMTKRKQMAGVLKQHLALKGRDDAVAILRKANIKGTQRPQEVSAEQWRALAGVLY